MLYADLVLPIPTQGIYTYTVPSALIDTVQEGTRVIVQFGAKKFYTAIVMRTYHSDEEKQGVKEIVSVMEDHPIVTPSQLRFWEWIAMYYMCALGDVCRVAIPSALKMESETRISLSAETAIPDSLNPNESHIAQYLQGKSTASLAEIEKLSGLSNAIKAVKSLADKGIITLQENIQENYSPKTISAVKLTDEHLAEEEMNRIADQLGRTPKQQHLLLTYLYLKDLSPVVLKKDLLEEAKASPAILAELVKKGILQTYDYQVSRFDYGDTDIDAAFALNPYQQKALDEIKQSFSQKDTTLLFGVTSSGKTEIYIQLIKEAIAQGRQVLYLLPEIALTTQITNRLKAVFGNKLAVYHSRFNDNERAEVWNSLLKEDGAQIVLGARSAIFLPFTRLGLIIVDEEHESSYKQQDPAPRYHARNAAIVLAGMHNAKTLLGTATPSIETYTNALAGRYGLVRLSKRHEDIELPRIEVVNTKELRRKKLMKTMLSPPLAHTMQDVLGKGEQVILFQNRRGFSSMLECKTCSWTPRCQHCDVSLTYHKAQNVLVCHYCAAIYKVPAVCPDCQTPTLDTLGYGTERIEEEVAEAFPQADIVRMDLDTTRGKRAYERIISDFENGRTNILIGTQMVSKGLDFDNVSTVGILNADNMLNYPDFRAYERAFQLMMQVSGRAGRKNKQGTVYLQTGHPGNGVINFVKNNDYESFYKLQMEERHIFRYPPFFRLINIVIRSRDEKAADNTAREFAASLRESFGERVLGPGRPPVARVQSLYIRNILLKIEHTASVPKVRETILYHQARLQDRQLLKGILLHYDVDPV